MKQLFSDLTEHPWIAIALGLSIAIVMFKPIYNFTGQWHPTEDPIIVRSVATPTPGPLVEMTETPGVSAENEGQGDFEADLQQVDGLYFPSTSNSQYQPAVEKGLIILCYSNPADLEENPKSRFLNGMPVGTSCHYFRVVAWHFSTENWVALSGVKPGPPP